MLTRFTQWQGREPESVAADTDPREGEFLQWLADRSITPYMRTRDSIHRKRSPFFGPERFTYEPENNRYICPAGQVLNYGGRVFHNRAFNYIGTRKKCGPCLLRRQCTSAAFRGLNHSQERTSSTTCAGVSQHAGVRQSTAAEKEGGGLVRETEESDRIAALGSAETQIRARAVLPGSGSSEHQATGALPQSANHTGFHHHLLVERKQKPGDGMLADEKLFR
jgi:hypothetical protein